MALINMVNELTGAIPKMPIDYATTIVNRAYADTRRKNLWSFQLVDANWVTPNIINTGTVTTVQGLSTVVFNLAASTAIAAVYPGGPLPNGLLNRQFRVGISTIYNIFGYAIDGGGIVTLTLDRPYTDVSGTSPYTIYQCYLPSPVKDFYAWINVRDILNFNDLQTTESRKDIDLKDPQRTIFYLPTSVVTYQLDQNVNGPTYQFPLFELWGQPQYSLVYQLYFIRKGLPLVNDSDTLPPQLGEDCIMALSRAYAYEWAEANKGDMPRNAGANYPFLISKAQADYKRLYAEYRKEDRELVDNWFDIRRHRSWLSNVDGFYNSIGNTANPGAPW